MATQTKSPVSKYKYVYFFYKILSVIILLSQQQMDTDMFIVVIIFKFVGSCKGYSAYQLVRTKDCASYYTFFMLVNFSLILQNI